MLRYHLAQLGVGLPYLSHYFISGSYLYIYDIIRLFLNIKMTDNPDRYLLLWLELVDPLPYHRSPGGV